MPNRKKVLHLQKKGFVAEWLGSGLQNRLQRFESARNLQSNGDEKPLLYLFKMQKLILK